MMIGRPLATRATSFLALSISFYSASSFLVGSNSNHQIKSRSIFPQRTVSQMSQRSTIDPSALILPTMIVFDLDDCLWSPEMYTLFATPSVPTEGYLDPDDPNGERGVVGMKVRGGPTVKLFEGARKALRELALDPVYKERRVILAAASSSEEPSYSRACLGGIEVLPGLTLRDMIQYDQIGRTGKLTSRKTTHFTLLHEESGVPYNEMLFFDDCNWGDHCADVTRSFGVVSQRTPHGMRLSEFHTGLTKYDAEARKRLGG